ncbi:DUF533 domain-containing protein [Rhodoplanes sp. SY1]|uniref:DUF533 domain-containing protein n=1 Tax=Rhodoplanes sp. SY1 TaxID=3166646 RepID=UPI0038B494DB
MDSKTILDTILGGKNGAAGGIGSVLGQAATDLQAGMRDGAAGAPVGTGSFASVIGQILGAAKTGVQEAARDVEASTGIGAKADAALTQATGSSAGDLLARARELVAGNQLAGGAALGGLAALLLGTGAGRGVAASAAKLGGLAMIGGLAYRALEAYKAGKPLVDLGGGVTPAPAASPFGETDDAATDQATALLLVRAMIAAAAADGVLDEAERTHIVGGLARAGLDADATAFLVNAFAKPLPPEALAAQATSPAVAAQVYAAARLAINPDNPAETAFLAKLAAALRLAPALLENLEAAAAAAQK